jgi:DNA-binding NarL/FixJ family response regulator
MRSARSDIVLVVDDSPETVRLLTDVLDAANFTVTVALDGTSALKVASRLKPDIVLMDAVMPGMDGFETCRQMKALPGFDNVPVIFMTGLSEDSVRGFQAGGADYVTKPIVVDSMLARIGVHLANARKIQSARLALDATDQYLLAATDAGEIRWFTPRAYRLIEQSFGSEPDGEPKLPEALVAWLKLRPAQAQRGTPGEDYVHTGRGGLQAHISFINIAENGEILLRISDAAPTSRGQAVKARFNLTQREAEVAGWMAQGKSNRDIAAILTLSPRTVDKHVEVIFTKLNVENRTAAAALILSMREA